MTITYRWLLRTYHPCQHDSLAAPRYQLNLHNIRRRRLSVHVTISNIGYLASPTTTTWGAAAYGDEPFHHSSYLLILPFFYFLSFPTTFIHFPSSRPLPRTAGLINCNRCSIHPPIYHSLSESELISIRPGLSGNSISISISIFTTLHILLLNSVQECLITKVSYLALFTSIACSPVQPGLSCNLHSAISQEHGRVTSY